VELELDVEVEDVSKAEDRIETMAGTRPGSSAVVVVAVVAVVAGVLGSFAAGAAGVGVGVGVTPANGGKITTGPALP
jgi:hypothetical protein